MPARITPSSHHAGRHPAAEARSAHALGNQIGQAPQGAELLTVARSSGTPSAAMPLCRSTRMRAGTAPSNCKASLHHPIQIGDTRPGTTSSSNRARRHPPTPDVRYRELDLPLQRLQNGRRHTRRSIGGRAENASSRILFLSALTRCLEEEASAIATAAERLSSDQVEAALMLERCADRKRW